ncbi:MAG: hypothetical protein ACKPH7_08160 [Planktothrix sp.]|uniref:hypothetical protein n=1 Tax=Planktothrix sp. TaxID=3088171 RepID=UPI0038D438C4
MNSRVNQAKILISVLARGSLSPESKNTIIATLKNYQDNKLDVVAIAKSFDSPKLIREFKLGFNDQINTTSDQLIQEGTQILFQGQTLGNIKTLYKSPLPGELQSRLSIETAIERFLEYLQKVHQIIVLEESDRHVRIFIPNSEQKPNFQELWKNFLEEVAFSDYGNSQYKLPGLVQTFIVMLKTVTLSGRGFSTLDVPIVTRQQADVLASWYYAVIRDVQKRQIQRQRQINQLREELNSPELTEKERKPRQKQLQEKEVMQAKEDKKYTEYFQKSFGKALKEQDLAWKEITELQKQLETANLPKTDQKKLQKQLTKLRESITFEYDSLQEKLNQFEESGGNPFRFVELDQQQHPQRFQKIVSLAKNFTDTATDQINSSRGDIFTQCLAEMYRLLEMKPQNFDSLPQPLLTEKAVFSGWRSPGDDSKEFCYSCGVDLDPKTAKWKVARFMFERPSQRRQSSASEDRPHICASCSILAFACPLKVTDESIIIQLNSVDDSPQNQSKIKDYIRMLTNKELNLSTGRYLILSSERTLKGDLASQKLGQVQYALAKVASLFPVEVLSDFKISLLIQGSEALTLANRHLILIKGLIGCYQQSIITSDQEVNLKLGDAIRYVEQDLPFLACYTLTRNSKFSDPFSLEKILERYWQELQKEIESKGGTMNSDNQLSKRAKLYRDVAALTGLTYAFAKSIEDTVTKAKGKEDPEREVSKLIEKVDDAVAFCYYATLGDETKKEVKARLWHNSDNDFIYEQTKKLLERLDIVGREKKDQEDDSNRVWLQLYADDVLKAYTHFAEQDYAQEKDWKELTYNLKLSLYTRFPELVRKLKSTSDK